MPTSGSTRVILRARPAPSAAPLAVEVARTLSRLAVEIDARPRP
jgi:hypothetical protein